MMGSKYIDCGIIKIRAMDLVDRRFIKLFITIVNLHTATNESPERHDLGSMFIFLHQEVFKTG